MLTLVLVVVAAAPAPTADLAAQLRQRAKVPELGYAVVSATQVLELDVAGVRKLGTTLPARREDRFRFGSNTKAVTSYLAAQLVHAGRIKWTTTIAELFPKWTMRPEHRSVTLLDLLTFRTRLPSWTYTNATPTKSQFTGPPRAQREQFAQWCLSQPPATDGDELHFSNPGYVIAGLMLERASGKTFEQLVATLGVPFEFGQPNVRDPQQPWGHDAKLTPEPPQDQFKLEWLQAAGNLNASLPGEATFIQLELQALAGTSPTLTRAEALALFTVRDRFALGWFHDRDEAGVLRAWNVGNPGSFLSRVIVWPELDRAIIIVCNAQTPEAEAAFDELEAALTKCWVSSH